MRALEYLEAAKVEEVADQLRRGGYRVKLAPAGADQGLDLVASKAGRKVAVRVKAQSELRNAAPQIAKLRARALKAGYDEFRLVVVNPPHEKTVEIEGLGNLLAAHMDGHLPTELDDIASRARVDNISQIEIDSVEVSKDGIRVQGNGVVDVALQYTKGKDRNGTPPTIDFPFRFDVSLDRDLNIHQVHALEVDTSHFYD